MNILARNELSKKVISLELLMFFFLNMIKVIVKFKRKPNKYKQICKIWMVHRTSACISNSSIHVNFRLLVTKMLSNIDDLAFRVKDFDFEYLRKCETTIMLCSKTRVLYEKSMRSCRCQRSILFFSFQYLFVKCKNEETIGEY